MLYTGDEDAHRQKFVWRNHGGSVTISDKYKSYYLQNKIVDFICCFTLVLITICHHDMTIQVLLHDTKWAEPKKIKLLLLLVSSCQSVKV